RLVSDVNLHDLVYTNRYLPTFSCYCYVDHNDLHSFPTRRSSDLCNGGHRPRAGTVGRRGGRGVHGPRARGRAGAALHARYVLARDRKSTRLNSSHVAISYAVFCLKKKNAVEQSTEMGDENIDKLH